MKNNPPRTGNLPSARTVAEWMVEQVKQQRLDPLRPHDAVKEVAQRFGPEFINENKKGRLTLRSDVMRSYESFRARGIVQRHAPQLEHIIADQPRVAKILAMTRKLGPQANNRVELERHFEVLRRFLYKVSRARLDYGPEAYPGNWPLDFEGILMALSRIGQTLGYAERYLDVERQRWINTFASLTRMERESANKQ